MIQELQQEDIRKLLMQKKLVSPELVDAIKKKGFVEIDDSGLILTLKQQPSQESASVLSETVQLPEKETPTSVEEVPSSSEVLTSNATEHKTIEVVETIMPSETPEEQIIPNATSAIQEQSSESTQEQTTKSTPEEIQTTQEQPSEQLTEPSPFSETTRKNNVEVVFSYQKESKKWTVQDFVQHYHTRYELLATLLRNHASFSGLISINSLYAKQREENVAIIGMVLDKYLSKNGHLIFTLEDPTGTIRVIVSKTNPLFTTAQDVVVDEVIGIEGFAKKDVIFANNIIVPDIPNTIAKKTAPTPGAAVFLSDIHIGSKQFLHKSFDNFIAWIKGEWGSEQEKTLAKNVKYILISGDVVDGVGIYPQQEKELAIPDIYEQYEALTQILKQIPSRIQIIIAPGNHDAMRLSEPQPSLAKSSYATSLAQLQNLVLISNPGIVNIHASEGFSGFNVLMYHGYSFDYYVAKVPSIRFNGGYDAPCNIMKFLLTRRHLAPAHTSTLYLPESQDDALVIKQVPDIFLAGHVHRTGHAYYRNVLLLNASCWQGITDFQERMGHTPSPAKAQHFDLQSRELTTLDFLEESEK